MARIASTIYYLYVGVMVLSLMLLTLSLSVLDLPVRVFSDAASSGGAFLALRTPSISQGDVVAVPTAGTEGALYTVRTIESRAGISYVVTDAPATASAQTPSVRTRDVYGTVALRVPYVGVVLHFLNTLIGMLVLVGAPLFMLVLDLLRSVTRRVQARGSSVADDEQFEAERIVSGRDAERYHRVTDVRRSAPQYAPMHLRSSDGVRVRRSETTTPLAAPKVTERAQTPTREYRARRSGSLSLQGYQVVLSQ